MHKRSTFLPFAAGVVATLLLAIVAWLALTYSGAWNVAASQAHSDPVRWTLDTVMHRSVARRADAVAQPDEPSREVLARGAGEYAEYCAHCHGAPGQERAGWTKGMRPQPPLLVEAAGEWSLGEIRWIIENGIRMTGMPAFGPYHDSGEIAAIARFVNFMPGLSAQDYVQLAGVESEGGGHSHEARENGATTGQ